MDGPNQHSNQPGFVCPRSIKRNSASCPVQKAVHRTALDYSGLEHILKPASVSGTETNRLIATPSSVPRRAFGAGDGTLARRQTTPITNASCQAMMTRHACDSVYGRGVKGGSKAVIFGQRWDRSVC